MAKLTKREVDNLRPLKDRDVFAWDCEIRGLGVRVKPTGVKTYFIQYRNADGRTRRLVIGKHGVLTADEARDLGRQKLAEASKDDDPSATRRAAREHLTVSEVCDWYLSEGRAGRLLGRNRRPIKSASLDGDVNPSGAAADDFATKGVRVLHATASACLSQPSNNGRPTVTFPISFKGLGSAPRRFARSPFCATCGSPMLGRHARAPLI